MSRETVLWNFVADKLGRNQQLVLLVVADSSGSSPGRAGYKMAVAADGELSGSIGGGVMEVKLVEQARTFLSASGDVATGLQDASVHEQVHRQNSPNASGMICSGRQTVIFRRLSRADLSVVESVITAIGRAASRVLSISPTEFTLDFSQSNVTRHSFRSGSEGKFLYRECLGVTDNLYIIGGGHCALALSELMARLGFCIAIFDDRPDLNTIAKNDFADSVAIIDSYEAIASRIPSGEGSYVVVMTLGYFSDAVVIRQLIDHDLKYFGVLGSEAKMATLMRTLEHEGHSADKLARIHTPIGLPINSHTPEEIAVSIAAEIIAVKNGAGPRANAI